MIFSAIAKTLRPLGKSLKTRSLDSKAGTGPQGNQAPLPQKWQPVDISTDFVQFYIEWEEAKLSRQDFYGPLGFLN